MQADSSVLFPFSSTCPHLARCKIGGLWLILLLSFFPLAPKGYPQTGFLKVQPTVKGATLFLNGKVVLRLRNPEDPHQAVRRAYLIAGRLQHFLDRGVKPEAVSYRKINGQWMILIGDYLLLTITAQDVQKGNTTPEALAQQWASNLKEALQVPALLTEPRSLLVPLGENRVLRLIGSAPGPFVFTLSPENLVTLQFDPAKREVLVLGKQVGEGLLTITTNGFSLQVPISVKEYAAQILPAKVIVTGKGPSLQLLQRLILRAVSQAILPKSNCVARWGYPPSHISRDARVVPISIEVSGEGYIPVLGELPVQIERTNLPVQNASILFYSNDPEMLRYPRRLYENTLQPKEVGRLLYHHQNMSSQPLFFFFEVTNLGQQPARLRVLEGFSPVIIDTYQAGHRAAASFLRNWLEGSGAVVDFQPGETLTLLSQRMAPKETVSGLYHLEALEGGPFLLQIYTQDAQGNGSRLGKPSKDVFPSPYKVLQGEYRVGDRWLFLSIGKEHIRDLNGRPLYGNYGVFYDLHLRLVNPSNNSAKIEILLEPSAGLARAIFLVNRELRESSHLQPTDEFLITQTTLQPRETREIRLLTLPLAGSHYPVRVIVRGSLNSAKIR